MLALVGQAGRLSGPEEYLLRLVDAGRPGWAFAAVALAGAFAVGALHALAPGHGKALVAAYLVGSRGRTGDTVVLGAVVSAMHTGSVLVLGLGLYAFTRAPLGGEQLAPFMTVAAGVLVVAVGFGLVVRQVRAHRAPGGPRGHVHALPPSAPPLSRRGLVLLGVSGGLLPSPAAFLVLATALFTGRLGFGLLLVAAFSLGLAATLTAIGLAVLRGRDLLAKGALTHPRLARVVAALPLVSACGVLLGGALMTTLALLHL